MQIETFAFWPFVDRSMTFIVKSLSRLKRMRLGSWRRFWELWSHWHRQVELSLNLQSSKTLSSSWSSSSSKGYVTTSTAKNASRNSQKPSNLVVVRYHLVSWFLTFLFIWPTLERSRRNSCVATVFPPLNSSREWTERIYVCKFDRSRTKNPLIVLQRRLARAVSTTTQ